MSASAKFSDQDLSTRKATDQDEPFLFELFREVRGEFFALLPLPEDQLNTLLEGQYFSQRMSYKAQYPDAFVEIVLLGDTSIGQLIHAKTSDHHCLVDISIRSEFQNQGIGSRMIQRLFDSAREANLPLRAHVANDNPRAKAFWMRAGFLVTSEDEVYTGLQFTPGTVSIPKEN